MLCITQTTYSKPQTCVHVDLYIKQSILHTSAHNLKAHFSEMLKIIQKQKEFKFIFWLLLSYLLNYMVIYKKISYKINILDDLIKLLAFWSQNLN